MDIKLYGDYHTHTPYSEGKSTVYENCFSAVQKGLKEIAITDHGFNHIFYGLRRKDLPFLRCDVDNAKEELGINVLMGMESNLIGLDGTTDMKESDLKNFDIYLCGVHVMPKYKHFKDRYYLMWKNFWAYKKGYTLSQKVVDLTTKAYIRAIEKHPIDILAHINYKCFSDAVEVAKCCSDYGTYLEINTKKRHISPETLAEIEAKTKVRFVIDSDAHSMDRVGDTKIAEDMITESGISLDRIDNIDGRRPTFRFAEYKTRNL